MTVFLLAVSSVSILLLIAAIGFIFIKRDMMKSDVMSAFSKILLYVCQPCLTVYSFSILEYSLETLKNIGIFALAVAAIHVVMLGGAYLVMRRKSSNVIYRIITIATTFSNCAFFGIPVIEALLPDVASDLIVYTSVYAIVMNLFAWTVGSAIIANDVKYISVKNIFINPSMIGIVVAVFLYLVRFDMPDAALSMITTMGRMATPISMFVMGMRLATMDMKKLFTDYRVYLTVAVNQVLMPLIVFAAVYLMTFLDPYLRRTLFIISACPVASIVLNYSEVIGEGQSEAANIVLLSTILSIVTLPFVMLLLPLVN